MNLLNHVTTHPTSPISAHTISLEQAILNGYGINGEVTTFKFVLEVEILLEHQQVIPPFLMTFQRQSCSMP